MTPVRIPAVRASVRPCPSCASNVFISRAVPSGCESRVTAPLVIVPSTSMRRTLICFARFATPAETLFPVLSKGSLLSSCDPLHQLQRPQVVQVHDAENATCFVDNHD